MSQRQANEDNFGQAGQMGHEQRTESIVVITQSGPANVVYRRQHGDSDLTIPAIFVCLCCFLPTGVFAIAFAKSAQNAIHNGNMAVAESRNKIATYLIRVSVFFGFPICIVIVYSIYNFLAYIPILIYIYFGWI